MAKCVTAVLAACLLFVALAGVAEAQPRAMYQQTEYKGQEIGNLTANVYYARMDDYLSVFMVTSEGIILVEPIGTEMATWLKGEMARRFKVPVRYVIYSHHHWDHASGGDVYADTAKFVGHENMLKNLALPPAFTPLPNNAQMQDANKNGRIERAEAIANIQRQFDLYDADKNGELTGAEVARGPIAMVRTPDTTYTDCLELKLGGKVVEVISRPIPHDDDNTLVRFVDGSNVLFASDWITVNRLPFGAITPEETAMVQDVAKMNFDHFVCSHGKLGTKADVQANIKYREDLRAAVSKAIADGQTLEQAQKSVTMDGYKNWEFFEQQRQANVTGFYRALSRK